MPNMPNVTSPASSRPAQPEAPRFTGVIIHRDPKGRFTIRYPSDWAVFEIAERPARRRRSARHRRDQPASEARPGAATGPAAVPIPSREGIGFAPDPADPHTVFTIWVSPLQEPAVAEDLDELKAGVDEGLSQLDGCQVEAGSETVLGNLIRFERVYTFREGGAVRKRKQWLLYVDRWLMCLTWQGSTVERYRHYFAMANYSFLTFELPEALWFATDRELLAQLGVNSSTV